MLITTRPLTGSKCRGIIQSRCGAIASSLQSGKNSVAPSMGISISTMRVTLISPKVKSYMAALSVRIAFR